MIVKPIVKPIVRMSNLVWLKWEQKQKQCSEHDSRLRSGKIQKRVFKIPPSFCLLQQKVSFNVHLLRNAQFLNPLKRKSGGTTSAISNLALKVTSVLKKVLGSIFQKGSKHAFVDVIRNQWNFINNEENFTCMLCKNWSFLEDWKFSWWIWS